MKPSIGDTVAVVQETEFGRIISYEGTLEVVGKGRKTEDGRAKAEPGEVTEDNVVDAPGWAILCVGDHKLSAPLRLVKLMCQTVRAESKEAEEKLATLMSAAKAKEAQIVAAQAFCEGKGLDVKSLSAENALKIHQLLS